MHVGFLWLYLWRVPEKASGLLLLAVVLTNGTNMDFTANACGLSVSLSLAGLGFLWFSCELSAILPWGVSGSSGISVRLCWRVL